MTDFDVAEGRRLLVGATPGPWAYETHGKGYRVFFDYGRGGTGETLFTTKRAGDAAAVCHFVNNADALIESAEEQAKASGIAVTKSMLHLPSGDYPVHANVADAFKQAEARAEAAELALVQERARLAEHERGCVQVNKLLIAERAKSERLARALRELIGNFDEVAEVYADGSAGCLRAFKQASDRARAALSEPEAKG